MNGRKLAIKVSKIEANWNKLYKRKKQNIDKILKNNFSKVIKI